VAVRCTKNIVFKMHQINQYTLEKKKAVNNRYKACASRQDCISVKEIGFERSLPEGGTISSASSRVN
jgi:hypothetical protein